MDGMSSIRKPSLTIEATKMKPQKESQVPRIHDTRAPRFHAGNIQSNGAGRTFKTSRPMAPGH